MTGGLSTLGLARGRAPAQVEGRIKGHVELVGPRKDVVNFLCVGSPVEA